MNFYWLYNLSNTQFFLVIVGFFIIFSLFGNWIFNTFLQKSLNLTEASNGIISVFLSVSGVFYGITLGLIAAGTFETFSNVDNVVSNESSALGGLYKDVSFLKHEHRIKLQGLLKEYTLFVVNEAWPMQQRGETPRKGTKIMTKFQNQLAVYRPVDSKDEIIYGEVLSQFNKLIECRGQRLNSISTSLPNTIWVILLVGAFVNLVFLWMLVFENTTLEFIVHILSALLLGSLIFLIAALDNPFRGEYSVGCDSFKFLIDHVMN